MIAFDTTTRSMTIQLEGAITTVEAQWISSWEDGSAGPVGTLFGSTAGATPVTVVTAPSTLASGTRRLASFSLFNSDTVQHTITATYADSDGPSTHVLQSVLAQPGESLIYEQNSGWSGLDVNGNTKVASNNVQVSTALSVASAASVQGSSMAALAPASVSSQGSSMALLKPASVSSQASSVAALNPASVSSNASLGALGSTQASSMHAALVNEALISSVASRTKSSFGW